MGFETPVIRTVSLMPEPLTRQEATWTCFERGSRFIYRLRRGNRMYSLPKLALVKAGLRLYQSILRAPSHPRLLLKLLLRRWFTLWGFCKVCGARARPFQAPEEIWLRVSPRPCGGGVLCYHCFCDRCEKAGLPASYSITPN